MFLNFFWIKTYKLVNVYGKVYEYKYIYIEIKDIFPTNVQVIITVIEEQLFVRILIFVNSKRYLSKKIIKMYNYPTTYHDEIK